MAIKDFKQYELHFAPLQGYTDHIFRNTFEKYFGGVDVYYTPFIRIEKGGFRNRDVRDVNPEVNSKINLIPQILPGTPEEFRILTDLLESKGYQSIDINLGCPFPPIAGKHKGSGMLPYPDQVNKVLQTIYEYPQIQFSVKMRLGWENVCECLNLSTILNELRLHHVTVHARIGKQQYKGGTNQEAFARFYELSKHPLFYNGDLHSLADIQSILEKFPMLSGVSIGRGLLSSPFIGKDFRANKIFSEEQRMSLLFEFHKELFSAYSELLQGENQLLTKMKTLWEYFLPTTDRKLLKRIKKSTKLNQYTETIRDIFIL